MATITQADGATVAQLHEAERIQARKGRCLVRLTHGPTYEDRVLMHVDVLTNSPQRIPDGTVVPYMTITLLPNGRPLDVVVHNVEALTMKHLDNAVLMLLSTHRERWWTVQELADALDTSFHRTRDACHRLVGISEVQVRGVGNSAYRHAEGWS